MRITLLTDFGTADGYVAAMKGAIVKIAPSVLIDDASHDIPPGDIVAAAFALRRYWRLYPEGTVHVVVVDPGVGSERRALLVEADGRWLIGPDNGVFTFVLQDAAAAHCRAIVPPDVMDTDISHTFHGRDIFAPAAARVAAGAGLGGLGAVLSDAVTFTLPPPIATESSVRGEIVHVDRFGNLISNIPRGLIQAGHVASIGEVEARIVATYSDAEAAEVVALVNSDGLLEVAVRDGSAALALQVTRGADVDLHFSAAPHYLGPRSID